MVVVVVVVVDMIVVIVKAFTRGAMGYWIDPIEVFLVPASAPRLV